MYVIIKLIMKTQTSEDKLLRSITRMGQILLENGAEISRVEDTMKRVSFSYGASVVDSYATPSMLFISYSLDGEMYHNMKRTKIKTINLDKIDKINNLSRNICKDKIDVDELVKEIDKIDNFQTKTNKELVILSSICAFGFAFIFGGGIKEAIASLIIGALLKILMIYLEKVDFVSLFNYIVGGAFVSLMATLLTYLNFSNLDTVIIASDMLLVPGLAITNAIRDLVSGDLISGMTRTLEAIIIALGIALGSAFILKIFGGV